MSEDVEVRGTGGNEPVKKLSVRSRRRLENAGKSSFCVKTSLRSALRSDLSTEERDRVSDALEDRVRESSRAAVRLGLAVNMYVRRESELGRRPTAIFDGGPRSANFATFLRQFALDPDATSKAHRSPEIADFLRERGADLPALPTRFPGDANIYTALLNRCVTNYKTYLSTQFPVVVQRLCDGWCRLHGVEPATAWRIRRAIVLGFFGGEPEKPGEGSGEGSTRNARTRKPRRGGTAEAAVEERGIEAAAAEERAAEAARAASAAIEESLAANVAVSEFVSGVRRRATEVDGEGGARLPVAESGLPRLDARWVGANPASVVFFFATFATTELGRMGDEVRRRREIGENVKISNRKLRKLSPIPLAPLHSLTAKSIYVDADVLHGIISEVFGPVRRKRARDEDAPSAVADPWRRVFDPDKFLTRCQRKQKGFAFARTLDTDGLAFASFHYHRPKMPTVGEAPTPETIPRSSLADRVIAVDPGRSNLFTAIELDPRCCEDDRPPGQRIVAHRLTRAEYYDRSGMDAARRRRVRWLAGSEAQRALDAVGEHRKAAPDLDAFLGYARAVVAHYPTLWAEYGKARWRVDAMRTFSGKQRVLETAVRGVLQNRPHDPRRTVVAYGDAEMEPGGRGERNVPVKRLRRVFERCNRGLVVPIDEYGTTKTLARVFLDDGGLGAGDRRTGDVHASKDGSRCEWGEETTARQGRQVRGLLWCTSTNLGRRLIDRDVNAAHNILELYHSYPERPGEMTRRATKILRLHYTIVVKSSKSLCGDGTAGRGPRNRFGRTRSADAESGRRALRRARWTCHRNG